MESAIRLTNSWRENGIFIDRAHSPIIFLFGFT